MKFVPSVLGGDVSGCLACPGGLLTRRVDVAELVRDRRTERVQLQRLLGDPVRMLARTRTETRGNPARGAAPDAPPRQPRRHASRQRAAAARAVSPSSPPASPSDVLRDAVWRLARRVLEDVRG